jgi:perosamine synthetase
LNDQFNKIINFVKDQFPNQDFIPLHAPYFGGNEKKYLLDTIDSTYVSSVGAYVNKFEAMMCEITRAKHSIAIVNGTNALHMALLVCGTKRHDEVITQSLTFIATCNAISYIGANPVFIDVDRDTLGLSPASLTSFLDKFGEKRSDGQTYNKSTGRRISACIPMHTFGLALRIKEIASVCKEWNIALIEDSAESLGTYSDEVHTGTFGDVGTFSFNGNKTVTCGGGGALVTNDDQIAKLAKHLTTQAKVPHVWEFIHDQIGYNYRMPNLNAALACAQLEQLDSFISNKRELAKRYHSFFTTIGIDHATELEGTSSNYWLNAIILSDINERNAFLQ